MANLCLTFYVIEGKKEEVKDLYQKLNSLLKMEKSLLDNGYGKNWLGNIVGLFGGDTEKNPCRGEYNNLEMDEEGTLIYLNTETAWNDMPEVFDLVISKYDTLSYYYRTEEGGVGYYATNDVEGKHFPERYIVDTDLNGTMYFKETEDVFEHFEEITSVAVSCMEELEEKAHKYNNNGDGKFFNIYNIEIVGV